MGALQLSGTTAFSSRTKHICTRYHFLRQLVASNMIIGSHVKTIDQLDIFTKILDYPKFKVILDKIINFGSWATLQDCHQHMHHHLYWGACVCYFVVYASDFVLIYTHFKFSLFAISTRYTRTWVSEVYVLSNWSYLREILVTLTTIATPKCKGGG